MKRTAMLFAALLGFAMPALANTTMGEEEIVEVNRTVSTYNKNGKETIILQDTSNKAGYIRYKNFKPLKEYDDY